MARSVDEGPAAEDDGRAAIRPPGCIRAVGSVPPRPMQITAETRGPIPARGEATKSDSARHDWTVAEVQALYELPFFELLDKARTVHRSAHGGDAVQLCTLLSVKTGGCPEDCAYCPQSSHYDTEVGAEKMLDVPAVLAAAQRAAAAGST